MARVKKYLIQDNDGEILGVSSVNHNYFWTKNREWAATFEKDALPDSITNRELLKRSEDPTTWEYISSCGQVAKPVEVKS